MTIISLDTKDCTVENQYNEEQDLQIPLLSRKHF